jgi:hypothetical protein
MVRSITPTDSSSQGSNSPDPTWSNVIDELNGYISKNKIVDTNAFQTIINGLSSFMINPAQQAAFQNLKSDFEAYCNHPSIGTKQIKSDINQLPAPNLTNAQFMSATNALLAQMYSTVGQGGEINGEQDLLLAIVNSPQLPLSFSQAVCGPQFQTLLSNYTMAQPSPSQADQDALQNGIQSLMGLLDS